MNCEADALWIVDCCHAGVNATDPGTSSNNTVEVLAACPGHLAIRDGDVDFDWARRVERAFYYGVDGQVTVEGLHKNELYSALDKKYGAGYFARLKGSRPIVLTK